MIVRVKQVRATIAVAGEVILGDSVDWHRLDIGSRVKTMVNALTNTLLMSRSIPKSDSSATALRKSHSLIVECAKRHVAGDVLNQDGASQDLLHLPNSPGNPANRFLGIRQGQKV